MPGIGVSNLIPATGPDYSGLEEGTLNRAVVVDPLLPLQLSVAQQELVYRVEARIDEVTPTGATPSISHGVIWNALVEASRNVLQMAPKRFVYSAGVNYYAYAKANASQRETHTYIRLPLEFVRFLRVYVVGWREAVDSLTDVDSDVYRQQSNPHQSARGGRPVAALVPYGLTAPASQTGAFSLELYPKSTGQTASLISELIIVPETSPELIPQMLTHAMTWDAASVALASNREGQAAGEASRFARAAMNELRIGMMGEDAQG